MNRLTTVSDAVTSTFVLMDASTRRCLISYTYDDHSRQLIAMDVGWFPNSLQPVISFRLTQTQSLPSEASMQASTLTQPSLDLGEAARSVDGVYALIPRQLPIRLGQITFILGCYQLIRLVDNSASASVTYTQ